MSDPTAVANVPPEARHAEAPAGGELLEAAIDQEGLGGGSDPDPASILQEDLSRQAHEILHGRDAAGTYVGPTIFNTHTHVDHISLTSETGDSAAADRRLYINRILQHDIEKMCRVYTAPSQHDVAMRGLEETSVLLLSGPPHVGKWTAALRLLEEFHDTALFQMPLGTTVQDLSSFEFQPNCGYVLDTFAPGEADQLDRSRMQDMEARLREKDSRLVITVDSRWTRVAGLGHYHVEWCDVADRSAMFRRHVEWYADVEVAGALISRLSQEEIVLARVEASCRPAEIDELAHRLVRADLDDEDLSALLTSLVPTDVKEWFAGHADPTECSYMIAFSVLSGVEYASAFELAAELGRRLEPVPDSGESPSKPSPFSQRRGDVLELTQARVTVGLEETEYGCVPVEQLWLDDSVDRPALLRYCWQEFDGARRPLLDWLGELGSHPSTAVRERAAAAVGELTKCAFSEVHRTVISKWAASEARRSRESAALALGIPAWDGTFAPQAMGVLHHWATLSNNTRLQWTAASAFGGLVGLRFPDVALRELRAIAQTEVPEVFHNVCRAVVALFEAGAMRDDYYEVVLSTLEEWADGSDPVESFTALMLFVSLASKSRTTPAGSASSRPTLLWLSQTGNGASSHVLELWRRILNDRILRPKALECLHRWMLEADSQVDLRPPVRDFVERLAEGSERDRGRMRAYLHRWASNRDGKSVTAAECLAAIS